MASDPRSSPIAVGTKPITVAKLVIAIGTKRDRDHRFDLVDAFADEASVRVVDKQDSVRHRDADDHEDSQQGGDREALTGGEQREHDSDERHRNGEEHDERKAQ